MVREAVLASWKSVSSCYTTRLFSKERSVAVSCTLPLLYSRQRGET